MNGRRPLESYAELKPTLVKALERRDIKEESGEHTIQKMISASHGKLTRDMVIDSLLNKATAQDPTLKYLIQEYYDGLLLYDISKAKVWDKAASDTVGLKKYFKEHKKRKYVRNITARPRDLHNFNGPHKTRNYET